MKDTMKDIDIKISTEIARATVHEMAQLKDTKTNKIFHIVAIVIMSIICVVCITFTSFIGLELIDFMNNTESVVEEEKTIDMNTGENGNISNVGNDYNNSGNVSIGDN